MSLTSDFVEKYIVPHTAKVEAALRDSANASESACQAIASLSAALHPLGLLFGSGRYRKPYAKQPGVQFAVFAEGRLTQLKRLADGSVVKV